MRHETPKRAHLHHSSGFTLLEVVLTIVIAAFLGIMLNSFFGKAITGSPTPVNNLREAFNAQGIMEKITSDYLATYTTNLAGLSGRVGSGAQNNAHYGAYTVVANQFITWTNYDETASGSATKCLKVTIRDNVGETLTQIFTDKTLATTNCQ